MAFGKLSTSTRIILFLISVIAILGLLLFKEWRSDQLTSKAVGSKASIMYDEIRDKAEANHPDKPLSESMRQEAVKKSGKDLSEKSGEDKAMSAASQFLGYYLVNVKTRYDYCKNLGVDITPFVSAFKAENKQLYEKSRAIVARGGVTSFEEIQDIYLKNSSPVISKVISDDMETAAKAHNISTKDVCGLYRSKGAELAALHKLSKRNPHVYKALVEAR